MVYLPQVFQFTPLREGRPAGIFDATRRPYFNSRPSARGDDGLHTLFERLPDFNSRPSARGDIAALVAFRHVEDFNSRPSARGDREFVHGAARVGISIHAPPRGATSQKNAKKGFTRFQFTPLREGRRAPVWYHIIRSNISIHAPPRGATGSSVVSYYQVKHFNSRPSARGDVRNTGFQCRKYFNSRPSARGDGNPAEREGTHMISIHAPPRGATNRRDARPAVPTFQFTPLREGRRIRAKRSPQAAYFNSRPSARGDDSETTRSRSVSISIHAPPRGATFCGFPTTFPLQISIHAPPRGATPSRRTAIPLFHFNSRPSARGDALRGHRRRKRRISIHAPPRGAT